MIFSSHPESVLGFLIFDETTTSERDGTIVAVHEDDGNGDDYDGLLVTRMTKQIQNKTLGSESIDSH